MKKTDLAYMAGIFDGEGCISIVKSKGKGKENPTYMVRAFLNMANPYIPQLFRFSFGGSIYKSENKSGLGKLPIWAWYTSSKKTLVFLETIKPYLRLKRSEADLAIQFQKRKKYNVQKGTKGGIKKTPEEWAVEEADRILLHNLKDKSK